MLDLSRIPLFSKDRDDRFPLIIAGGPSAFNPAPVADFFDAIVIGDGEEVVLGDLRSRRFNGKRPGRKKEDLLKSLSPTGRGLCPQFTHRGAKSSEKNRF